MNPSFKKSICLQECINLSERIIRYSCCSILGSLSLVEPDNRQLVWLGPEWFCELEEHLDRAPVVQCVHGQSLDVGQSDNKDHSIGLSNWKAADAGWTSQ